MATFAERVRGALMLDVRTYEEVEADESATGQAMTVVVLGAVSTGLVSFASGVSAIAVTAFFALAAWGIWAWLTYTIGARLMPEPGTRADLGQLLRTIGFSASPTLLGILGVVPAIGLPISIALMVWQLVAMVIAVRQALDYTSTVRADVVCLIGWVIYFLIWLSSTVVLGLLGLVAEAVS